MWREGQQRGGEKEGEEGDERDHSNSTVKYNKSGQVIIIYVSQDSALH